LMRIFEEEIRKSLDQHDPELSKLVKLTSAELADACYASDDSTVLRPAVIAFFAAEHQCSPETFRTCTFREDHSPRASLNREA